MTVNLDCGVTWSVESRLHNRRCRCGVNNGLMVPRLVIAVAVAGAVFALSLATFKWNGPSFALSALLGAGAGAWAYRWNLRLERAGISPAARERVAMQTAWRKGGKISPAELERLVGMPQAQARETLEALCERGLCLREGESFIFYTRGHRA